MAINPSDYETGTVAEFGLPDGSTISIVNTGTALQYQGSNGDFRGKVGDDALGDAVASTTNYSDTKVLQSPSDTAVTEQIYEDSFGASGSGLNPNRFSPSDSAEQRKVKSFMRNRGVRDTVKSNPLIPSSKEDEAREQLAKEILEAFDNAGSSDRRRQRIIERYDLES